VISLFLPQYNVRIICPENIICKSMSYLLSRD
jgi:hypothetical protein